MKVRCNLCDKEFDEEDIELYYVEIEGRDIELCPFCKRDGYLMDIE